MGCGQSKIGNIYTKNKKNKSNHSKKSSDSTRSSSIDQKNGSTKSTKTNNNGIEVNRNEDQTGPIDNKNLPKKKVTGSSSSSNGPLLHQTEVSSSQLDFFRMLDEKIENGPDYDGSVESTMRMEHVTDLLHRWELASMIWPSVTDLRDAAAAAATTITVTKSSANAMDESCERPNIVKDRDTIRNIIGGRSEIAPVFTRNTNRTIIDGLQQHHINSPSPNMPRHVLESISQSPTQSLKNTSSSAAAAAGTSSSPYSHQCNEYIDENNVTSVNKMSSDRMNYQCQRNTTNDDENDYISPQAVLYREQYLQQTGIISIQPPPVQYQSGNIVRNNSYVQPFQKTNNEQHFQTPKKRKCNVVRMT